MSRSARLDIDQSKKECSSRKDSRFLSSLLLLLSLLLLPLSLVIVVAVVERFWKVIWLEKVCIFLDNCRRALLFLCRLKFSVTKAGSVSLQIEIER